jgi:hypothetical protein
MGIVERILERLRQKKVAAEKSATDKTPTVRKYVSLADYDELRKRASKGKLIKWFSVDGIPHFIVAGKSKSEIIEDEIIRLTNEVVTLQKLLGKMNAKVAAIEKKLFEKVAAEDITLSDILGKPEEETSTEQTSTEEAPAETTTTETTEKTEEPKTEEKKPEEAKTEGTSSTISVSVDEIKKLINKDVKSLTFKGLNISKDGKTEAIFEVETSEGKITASIERRPDGTLIYKEAASDPTKFMSKYKFDPVTKMVTPMPKGENVTVMVDVDKKAKPKGEVTIMAEEVEKSQKPSGNIEIAVSEPKGKKASIYNLARTIVTTAAKKGIIPNDPDSLSVRFASLVEKDEETLESILNLIEVADPDVTVMDEEGNIFDLKDIKENILGE